MTQGKSIGLRLLAAARDAKHSAAIMSSGLCLGLLAGSFIPLQAAAAGDAAQLSGGTPHRPQRANFEQERASRDDRHGAYWVVHSCDNQALPFVIVDKTDARVFVFDAHGRLLGAAAALLGLALGDDSVPGIGDRALSAIRPEERTTPAGRFVASLGRNSGGVDILWVDYEAAISLHRVITTQPGERRLQRLATPTPRDNRISYGCINVPAKFYETVVSPAFTGTDGIVYVLPETRSPREVFASYDLEEHAPLQYVAAAASSLSVQTGGVEHARLPY
jgi:hypothetical protein